MRPSASGIKNGSRPPETRLRMSAVMNTVLPARDSPVTPRRKVGVIMSERNSPARLRAWRELSSRPENDKGTSRGVPLARAKLSPGQGGLLAVEDDEDAGGHHAHAHEDDQAAANELSHVTLHRATHSKVSILGLR